MDLPYLSRPRPYRIAWMMALLLLLPVISFADTIPDPEQEGLPIAERSEKLIERIKYEQAQLKTMKASFTQRKESVFLIEPEESQGQFWYHSPDRVRWDFTSPNNTTVLISANEMLTWFKDLGSAERVNVGKQADKVMEYLSASNSLETLQGYFNIRTTFPKDPQAPFKLQLIPKFKRVSKKIKGMSIHLHRTGYYPVYLEYIDPEGDKTQLSFQDVLVNQNIDDTTFDLALPDDVEVKEVDLRQKNQKSKKGR